jgi:two-component system invasion response regulator UvrY
MLSVLIADDHPIVRKGIRRILQDEFSGIYIEEANDAESAIEKTYHNDFDLILADLSMPGRNGLDVVSHVKKNFPKLPVLVLSIHSEEQYAMSSLEAGAAGYLNKDTASEKLIDVVETVLKGEKYFSASVIGKMKFEIIADPTRPMHELLSEQEFKIFKLLAGGKTIPEISRLLFLNISEVNKCCKEIFYKMDMKTNAELLRHALNHKLI